MRYINSRFTYLLYYLIIAYIVLVLCSCVLFVLCRCVRRVCQLLLNE